MTDTPCPCWSGPPWLHEGHCCFMDGWNEGDEVLCGHDETGLALASEYAAARELARKSTNPLLRGSTR